MSTQSPILVASWHEVLVTCEEQIQYERGRLRNEMEKRWPVGTEVSFWFNRRAKNCTIGTVIDHGGDGRVRVQLGTTNRRGYYTKKWVSWRHIS
jgi:hypothetical protein